MEKIALINQFQIETQGNGNKTLVHTLPKRSVLDHTALGMLAHNKLVGILPPSFVQVDGRRTFRYNISELTAASDFFDLALEKRQVLNFFISICSGVIAIEDYLMDPFCLLLDMEYLYVSVDGTAYMVYFPTVMERQEQIDYSQFLRSVIDRLHLVPYEDGSYITNIAMMLKSDTFDVKQFMKLLQSMALDTGILRRKASDGPDAGGEPEEQENTEKAKKRFGKGFPKLFGKKDKPEKEAKPEKKAKKEKSKVEKPKKADKKKAKGISFAVPGKDIAALSDEDAERQESPPVRRPNESNADDVPPPAKKEPGQDVFFEAGTVVLGADIVDDYSRAALTRCNTGEKIFINKSMFFIGRNNGNDYVINENRAISSYHAALIKKSGLWYLVDKGSKNKTFLNDIPVEPQERAVLTSGSRIMLGNELFLFEYE